MSLFALIATGSFAQSNDKQAIKQTITEFSKAGDASDVDKLATYLDDNYRVVMNRLFGSTKVTVLSKDAYLEKIKKKEFGGDKREINIESITLNGTTASAKVSFAGSKMTFVSILTLIKDKNDQWKIVTDVPVLQ